MSGHTEGRRGAGPSERVPGAHRGGTPSIPGNQEGGWRKVPEVCLAGEAGWGRAFQQEQRKLGLRGGEPVLFAS